MKEFYCKSLGMGIKVRKSMLKSLNLKNLKRLNPVKIKKLIEKDYEKFKKENK